MSHNPVAIRMLVTAAFSDDELKAFCFDHFPAVYQDFTAGQTQGQRAQLLLDFAARQGQLSLMLGAIERANPYQYNRFSADLGSETLQPGFETKPGEPETVPIPAGSFLMGRSDAGAAGSERPQHPIGLPDFRIGKYPVTNAQYAAFIREQKAQPAPRGWFNREPPVDRLDHPVTDVSWFDAAAYCAWLSSQTGRRYTLPSEAEWEKACSNDFSRSPGRRTAEVVTTNRYPWGEEPVERRCNAASSGTTAVTAHPEGASASGVEDLLGNVQEWTRSLWGRQPQQPDYGYPYDPADGREVTDTGRLPPLARLVHRGGSFKSAPADLRCTARGNALPDSKIAWRGFRVAMVIE